MQGLTDDEMAILEDFSVGPSGAISGGRELSPEEYALVVKLIERGLLAPWVLLDGDAQTSYTTAQGALAIRCTKAARKVGG